MDERIQDKDEAKPSKWKRKVALYTEGLTKCGHEGMENMMWSREAGVMCQSTWSRLVVRTNLASPEDPHSHSSELRRGCRCG